MNEQKWSLKKIADNLKVVTLLFVVLSFAPFDSKPHLYEKLQWAYYGAEGMRVIDFIDLAFHLLPTILLLRLGVLFLVRSTKHA
jgi:hypothetical protein